MTNAVLAEPQLNETQDHIKRATVLKVFAVIAVVSFLLRIFYARHLYEDDGLWFTAAEEIVRGKALYREIYLDKPPGLALVYGALFGVFGPHVIVIRLFTIAYSIAISVVLYLFGSRLYGKRVGLLAAGLFAVFSTTYTTGHVQGLGTDFLMALPYCAGAYLLVRSLYEPHKSRLAAFGGVLVAVAFQMNPKGIFDLIFFSVLLIVWPRWNRHIENHSEVSPSAKVGEIADARLRLFALGVAGFLAGSIPFLAYLAAVGSLREYWLYVWDWGFRYGSYNPISKVFLSGLTRSIDYFALNNTLLIALVFICANVFRRGAARINDDEAAPQLESGLDRKKLLADRVVLVWLAVSYGGVLLGGRLYSHYFLQILPALSLVSARGLSEIAATLKRSDEALRKGITTILVLGFVFTLIRFHGRTVALAADMVRGRKSEMTAGWFHERIDSEERLVAAAVRELPEHEIDAGLVAPEALRSGGPRMRAADAPTDYLFVWGYRPEIYYISGLLPASRYLSTQPLTGVPADVHYFANYRSVLDPSSTAAAREQLVRDLRETRPKYIIDELGMFNADLSINSYPELEELMKEYKPTGPVERFMIYCRRDLREKNLRLTRDKDQ